MNHAPEFSPLAGLARHPKLVAAAIALAMLLFASTVEAANRGSAQNPILLPGTETSIPRIVAQARRDRVVLHRGTFEATLYSTPTLAVLPGTHPAFSPDMQTAGAATRAELDAGQTARTDLGATGLKLSVQPSWDVEVEGHDFAYGATGDPAVLARTSGLFRTTVVGVEVRF